MRGLSVFDLPRDGSGLPFGEWHVRHNSDGFSSSIAGVKFHGGRSVDPVPLRLLPRMLSAMGGTLRAEPASEAAEVEIVARSNTATVRKMVLSCCSRAIDDAEAAELIAAAKGGAPIGLLKGCIGEAIADTAAPEEPAPEPSAPSALDGLTVREATPLIRASEDAEELQRWRDAEASSEKPSSTILDRIDARLRALSGADD